MNPNYNKYKKYKFKYKKLIEPFKDIIDKIDISDELLNETYLKNKDYFDNLINIKNEGNVYKYKYQKYKTKYLFINKKLNGGTNPQVSEDLVCRQDHTSEDRRKTLTETQKGIYYASKFGKIGASSFLKVMAIIGSAVPGGQVISAIVGVVSTGKDIYDYVLMKKYEFFIIYSIFIFLEFSTEINYFISSCSSKKEEKSCNNDTSLVEKLEKYLSFLEGDNKKKLTQTEIDEIYFKLNLLNDGMITIPRYNACMKYVFKFIEDIKKKDLTDAEIKIDVKETAKQNQKKMQDKFDELDEDNKKILNYLVKDKKIFQIGVKKLLGKKKNNVTEIDKEICRIKKLIDIINNFKETIYYERDQILNRYSNINCLSNFDKNSKLKLIYLLESSYVYAFTNKNSNAILFNGLYNIILKNNRGNSSLNLNDSLQIANMYELLSFKLRKDRVVKSLFAGDGFFGRKYVKAKGIKKKVYITKNSEVECTKK